MFIMGNHLANQSNRATCLGKRLLCGVTLPPPTGHSPPPSMAKVKGNISGSSLHNFDIFDVILTHRALRFVPFAEQALS